MFLGVFCYVSEDDVMTENEVSKIIVNTCYKIDLKLGPGLLESVYEAILAYDLKNQGLRVERQQPMPVIWEDVKFNVGFRRDLLVENKVIVELKSIEKTA